MNVVKYLQAAAVSLLVGFVASPSSAAPVTHSLAGVIDASTATAFNPGPNYSGGTLYNVQYTGFPFQIGEGDTISIHFTTTNGGVVVNDAGAGLFEGMQVGNMLTNAPYAPTPPITPSTPIVLSYDYTTTVTVSTYTGSLISTSLTYTVTNNKVVNTNFAVAFRGDFTNSQVTLTDFTVATTFTNIVYQPGYESLASYNTISGTGSVFGVALQAPVPAPAALTLVALGVCGIGALRRRKMSTLATH